MLEISLKVDSAYPEDQGSGKARLDPETMQKLGILPGQLVVIEGKTSKEREKRLPKSGVP